MKNRIFINMHYMEIGGAERALLGLLYAIDTEKVDVDLFINQHTGPFMELIPKQINLLPEIPQYSAIERPLSKVINEGHFLIALGRIIAKIKHKIFRSTHKNVLDGMASQFLFDGVTKFLPSLSYLGEYDLAISFLDPPHIVQDKVIAKKRVEWIHTDFSGKQFVYDPSKTYERWASNDFVISISDDVTKEFLIAFPTLKDKIIKIENIIPQWLIKTQASQGAATEFLNLQPNILKICSVGRISQPKNFGCIPSVSKILRNKGLIFKWIIVGPGDIDKYNSIAKDEGVEEYVLFVGPRDNPYPYMNACDIYVQPSLFEGKAVTVQEAQMLGKPVIITRYPTSASQVVDGEDGIICEKDNISIAEAIWNLSNNISLMKYIGEKASILHRGNNEEVMKIYDLLN